MVGLDTGLDLAVEVAPMDYTVTYKTDLEAVDVEIREAFLHYFATIMGNYRFVRGNWDSGGRGNYMYWRTMYRGIYWFVEIGLKLLLLW